MKAPTRYALLLAGLTSLGTVAMANEKVDHSAMGNSSDVATSKMFFEQRDINGYMVSFHVMEATPDTGHGGSHNFMIKVEQRGQVVEGIKINSKVKYPNGEEQSKRPMKMGDWYTAGYDLGFSGKHQLMVLFKTLDGKKHFGGVHYQGN